MEDSDGASGQGSELKRALAQRRKVVDAEGSKFVKDPSLVVGGADVSWEEHHESQFTPRGKHKKADFDIGDDTLQKEVTVNGSLEKPSQSNKAGRSSKANVKPSAKSRLAQFFISSSSATNAVESRPESTPEVAFSVVEPTSVSIPQFESTTSVMQALPKSGEDVTSPLVMSSALPEWSTVPRDMKCDLDVTSPLAAHEGTPNTAPILADRHVVVTSSSAMTSATVYPSIAASLTATDLDVTAQFVKSANFSLDEVTVEGTSNTALILPDQHVALTSSAMASAIVEPSIGASFTAADLDVTAPFVKSANSSLNEASAREVLVQQSILSAATATHGEQDVNSNDRNLADVKKSKLLLPKELDSKLLPLDELPHRSSSINETKVSNFWADIAALELPKPADPASESMNVSMARSTPDVVDIFDKRKSAASSSSTASPSQAVHKKPTVAMKRAPPDVEAESSASVRQNGDCYQVSDQRLWHAVVEGNIKMLEELANQGVLSSGRVIDHNMHSVFWNAVAFQQLHAALWLLKRFPPDAAGGVDMREVHARRGDSLLHMCLYFSEFSAAVADLFQRVFFRGAPRSLLNQNGHSFLTIAASRLNFWVIRFAVTHSPDSVDLLLVPDKAGNTPLAILQKQVHEVSIAPSIPSLPGQPLDMKLPVWCALKQYKPVVLAPNSQVPIFSDVILEVEDPSVSDAVVQIAAHRVVIGACSSMLESSVQKSGHAFIHVDPRCCRSVEVILTLLHFCYSGELLLTFPEDGFLLWQSVCLCAKYGLPAALTSYLRILLVRSLVNSNYAEVSAVLLQASDKLGLTHAEAAFAARAFIANSKIALASIDDGGEKASLLDSVLAQLEQYVVQESASSVCSPGKRLQAQNVPIAQVFSPERHPRHNGSMAPSAGGS